MRKAIRTRSGKFFEVPSAFARQWGEYGTLYTFFQEEVLLSDTMADLEEAFGERDDRPTSLELAAGFPWGVGDHTTAEHGVREWRAEVEADRAARNAERAGRERIEARERLAAAELRRALERQAIDERKARTLGARFLERDPKNTDRLFCPLCRRHRRQTAETTVLCLHNGRFQVRFPQSDEWTETG